MYESIDKKMKLENQILSNQGLETISESNQYKQTVDGMAKHIVYGNIIIIIIMQNINHGNCLPRSGWVTILYHKMKLLVLLS